MSLNAPFFSLACIAGRLLASLLLIGAAVGGSDLRAQSDTGSINGRVEDAATGSFVPGSEVYLPSTGQTAVSDRDGSFVLRAVPAGEHTLVVNSLGYNERRITVTVTEGQRASVPVALQTDTVVMKEFRIEGAREGQARAINQQRAATNLKNLVSADAIGNFPDVNAAEALKRISGVSTVRQRGEDRDITIRGAAPNLNSITLDGVSVLSNQSNGRTVSMDVYPAEQLAGVEIVKASTPDMDGDSIGGAINLKSKSAFDTDHRVLSINAYLQYNDLAEQFGYRGGVNYADLFGADRGWGLQFSASRAQRKALEETAEPAGWAFRSGTAAGVAYGGMSPNNIPFTYVDIERERTGGSLSLERRLGGTTRLFIRGSYNEFVERNGRPRLVIQQAGTIDTSRPVTVTGDRITSFSSAVLRGQRVVNPRTFTDTGAAVSIGGETEWNDWKLSLVGAYALGTNDQNAVTGQWQTPATVVATFDLSDTSRPRYTRISGPDLNDPAAYQFSQMQIQDRALRNREYSVKGDASRELILAGRPLKLTGGFKFRWSPKKWDQETFIANSLASGTLALNDSRLGTPYEVDSRFLGGLMAFGPTAVPYSVYEFARANRSLFVPNAGNTLQNSLGADYHVEESIHAGYLMAEWTAGPFTALAGARFERTEIVSKGFTQNAALATSNPARYTWTRTPSDYDNWLPGVHLRYAPKRDLVFRASVNQTLARPETNRIASSLNVTRPVNPTASDPILVSGGNPGLKATTSTNFDLSAEYYLKSIGLVSAGYFRKDLDGPIYRSTFDGTYENSPARFTLFSNAGKARVSGWELSYQQNLTFLPGPLDGLGIYANFTRVSSEVTLTEPGRIGEKLPLFNQSDDLGNLALTYQKHGLLLRISHNWRGDFLSALGNPGFDEYARGFESYDFLATYRINERWSVRLEAANFTNAPEEQYAGTSERRIYYGDTGRSYALGVHWNY